jgi:hypothetical protein
VAPDHPWVTTRPQCLLAGSDEELALHPEAFIRTAGGVFANARDPYFPPWPDVACAELDRPVTRPPRTWILRCRVGGWQAPTGHPIDPLPYLEAWEHDGAEA